MLSNEKNIKEIKESFENIQDQGIDKYLNLLVSEDYGFYTKEPELFPDLELDWDSPYRVTNSIVDFNETSNHPIEKIINELSELGCRSLLLRFFDQISNEDLKSILDCISNTRINSVELVLEYDKIFIDSIKELYLKYPYLKSVTLYNAPQNHFQIENKTGVKILMTKIIIDSEELCGVIDPSLFTINTQHFTESLAYNSCLNCKLSIDKNGFVKNCPSMDSHYLKYGQVSLKDIVKSKEFNVVEKISKDQISVCKDCEFRHACTDCRAYRKDVDIHSKPLKCKYDPYTAKWSQ